MLLAMGLGLAAPVQAQETREKVVFGASRSADVPQLAVAIQQGLFEKVGIDVKLVPFVTGRDAFEALIGGQLDVALMAEFPPVVGALRGLDFDVLGVASQYKATRIIVKNDGPVADVRALEGHRIALPLGTNSHFLLSTVLAESGIKAELVNVGPSDIIPALIRGDVTAGVLFPSAYAAARNALGGSYREIPVPQYATRFVLSASSALRNKPEVARTILDVLVEADEFLDKEPATAQQLTADFVQGALNLEQVKSAWGDYGYRIQIDQETLDQFVKEGRWLREAGYVKEGEPTANLFRKHFAVDLLRSVDPSRVTID